MLVTKKKYDELARKVDRILGYHNALRAAYFEDEEGARASIWELAGKLEALEVYLGIKFEKWPNPDDQIEDPVTGMDIPVFRVEKD